MLLKAIYNLSLLKDCKIIIYNGPVTNDFRSKAKKAGVYQLEAHYDQVMKSITKKYPNIAYISFLDNRTLGDQYFYDGQHLCESGAAIFTKMISQEVE